jgi:hypothetical protein
MLLELYHILSYLGNRWLLQWKGVPILGLHGARRLPVGVAASQDGVVLRSKLFLRRKSAWHLSGSGGNCLKSGKGEQQRNGARTIFS